jgi:hypothetical protein
MLPMYYIQLPLTEARNNDYYCPFEGWLETACTAMTECQETTQDVNMVCFLYYAR